MFVNKQSKLQNLPMYGNINDIKQYKVSDKKSNKQNGKKKVLTTLKTNKDNTIGCLVCKQTNHYKNTCFFFKKKSRDDNVKFIKDQKLCFGCLLPGHMTKMRKDRSTC